jgi:hypothetical protein
VSGVIQPAYPIVEPFGKNAGGAYIQLPIPVPSQIGISNGVASFNDGYVPLNMTDPTVGGVPPRGKDMNGILYMITQYCALLQAGQTCEYSSAVSTAISGYASGALLAKVDGSGFWFNIVSGNTTDPDAGGAGWVSFTPQGSGYLAVNIPSGNSNNYAPTGFNKSVGVLDVNPNSGASVITGIAAGTNNQRILISNVNASNSLTISSMNGSSSGANQIRLPVDITLLQYGSITLQYSTGAGLWLAST